MTSPCERVCSHSYTRSSVRTSPAGMPLASSRGRRSAKTWSANTALTAAMTASRLPTRWVVVALRVGHLAGDRIAGALEGVHPDDRGQKARPHDPSDARRVALVQSGDDAIGAVPV